MLGIYTLQESMPYHIQYIPYHCTVQVVLKLNFFPSSVEQASLPNIFLHNHFLWIFMLYYKLIGQ